MLNGRVNNLEVVHASDPNIGTGRNGLDPVFGLAAPKRPQAGAEPDEELGDLHPTPAGHQVVAQLVEDQDD